MKHIIKLIIILSLFAQVCNAQKVETVEEYKVLYSKLASRLRIAEKDSSCFIGKPFSELAKHLEKCGVKIESVGITNFDSQKVTPQNLYGIRLLFIDNKIWNFALTNELRHPDVYVDFNEILPYQQALSLVKEYKGNFTEEVEEFYSKATVKSLLFAIPDNLSMFPHRNKPVLINE